MTLRLNNKALFVILFIFAFLVRLYRIDNPIADWHAWRQADTAAVSKVFVTRGFDVLYPRYYDIANIQSGKDNPSGYRFVEFPVFNIIHSSFYSVFNFFSLEMWGRLTSVLSSLASLVFLYLLVKKYASETHGLITAFFFAFLPFSVYYSRTILPDQMMVTALLGGIYFLDLAIEKKFKTSGAYLYLILAILSTASSFLLKPFSLFFTLPMIYIAYKAFGFFLVKKWQLWIFLIASVIPLIWWRQWILQHPEGIPVSDWLFNGNGIRFRPSFFRWIFYKRITELILGYFGSIFLILGVVKLRGIKSNGFFLSFLASTLIYLFVIATGNVQHDYYQIPIIPTLCILVSFGVVAFFTYIKKYNLFLAYMLTITLVTLSLFFSWRLVKDYFNVNNNALVIAGKKADEVIPKDAKVIAIISPTQTGDTSLLYYVGRPGWPSFQSSIEDLIQMGATHLVLANPSQGDFDGFGKKYKIVAQSKEYLILDLR